MMTDSPLEQPDKSVDKRGRNLSVYLIEAKARADDFAQAHAEGRTLMVEALREIQHFAVLNMLVAHHSLGATKAYAGLEILTWGRFSGLDRLRSLLLHLPEPTGQPGYDLGLAKCDRPMIVCPFPGATRTVVVFTDVEQHLGAPLRLVHPWLWQLGVNVIYLSEPHFNYFLGPIDGLGVTIEDKAASIRQALCELGDQPVVCLGNSGGGFGALLLAPLLGAERTLVYSAPTVIRESLPLIRQRVPDLDPRLWQGGEINIASRWRAHTTTPETRIYYPGLLEHDQQEARNMADIPGVALFAMAEYAQHNLLPFLIADGSFARHLEWLSAG